MISKLDSLGNFNVVEKEGASGPNFITVGICPVILGRVKSNIAHKKIATCHIPKAQTKAQVGRKDRDMGRS